MPSSPGQTNFPAALDDAVALVEAANNAAGLLASPIGAGDSTLTLASGGSAFSNSGILWVDAEAMAYTSRSGNVFSGLTRGLEGTTAAGHLAGANVEQAITALSHKAHSDALIAVETKLGVGADTPTPLDFLRAHPTTPGVSQWTPLTSNDVQTAMGFTPVNKAGDTMTGDLVVPDLHATANLQVDGDADIEGALNVDGAVTLGSTLAAGDSALGALVLAGLLTAKSAKFTTRTVTGDYTIADDDFVLFVNPSVAHVNLTFPDASGQLGRMLVTKRGPFLSPWRWQLLAHTGQLLEFGPSIGTVATRFYDVDWGGHWWVSDGSRWRVISYL